MSSDAFLFIRGRLTPESLADSLRPHFQEELTRGREHDGSAYWDVPYGEVPTSVGSNLYESDEYDASRFPACVSFHGLRVEGEALEEWLERAWREWLPWLEAAGAEEVLLVRDFGPILRRWQRQGR